MSESNLLNAQSVIISEFMAANDSGLQDEDGDFSDWIELHNPGVTPVSLEGWFLTDDPQNLQKWRFPNQVIPSQGYLVVFASGKDRASTDSELHASFNLNRSGEYLALVKPNGVEVQFEYSPGYPEQKSDVSYGLSMDVVTRPFIGENAFGKLMPPRLGNPPDGWKTLDFNDSDWLEVRFGIGYDRVQAGEGEVAFDPAKRRDVTAPSDGIVPTSLNSPVNEEVEKAIDDNPSTKYLNFDKINAGLTVTPETGPTVITGLRFTSANDAPDRDPTGFLLQGSNNGTVFTPIAGGAIPDFPSRFFTVEVEFNNDEAYRHYRLLFTALRNAQAAVAVQIAEIEFLGWQGEPLPVFSDLIQTDIGDLVQGIHSSVFTRIPFTAEPGRLPENLILDAWYDDGWVAYLNGVKIADANAPVNPNFDVVALTDRPRMDAIQMESFAIDVKDWVQVGRNILAVQGINSEKNSPDFLLDLRLHETQSQLGAWGYFKTPTPRHPNEKQTAGFVSVPTLTPDRGIYNEPINVVMKSPTADATIRFTLDGTLPTPSNGERYIGPRFVNKTSIIRARAFREGWEASPVATSTYLFPNDIVKQSHASALQAGFPASWGGRTADYGLDPRVAGVNGQDAYQGKYSSTLKEDLLDLPTLSIVMEPEDLFGRTGIYSNPENRGDAWERPASLELIHPDGTEGFQINAGIRIQGGAFRRFDLTLKKSFRMIFSKDHGPAKLQYALFGPDAVDEFDNFILRANSNDAWPWGNENAVYVRDAFGMESLREMEQLSSRSIFTHLYLNGQYWGLYNPTERPDASFSASYHGGDKETWDAINQDSVPDGNREAWNRLLSALNTDATSREAYMRIQGKWPDGTRNPDYEVLLDVENMIDYMIMNFYVGNVDWPHRNYWVGRDREGDQGFQFYPWDTETALGLGSGLNTDRTGVNNAVATPYGLLKGNAEFRMQFADQAHKHFSPGGVFYVNPNASQWDPAHPENNRPAARFVRIADGIRKAIVAESARWGDQLRGSPYTRDEHWQREIDGLLQNYFPDRSHAVLEQFRRANLYPSINAPVFSRDGGRVPSGFQLAIQADQGTVYYSMDGSDPRTPIEVEAISKAVLVKSSTPKRIWVPRTNVDTAWRETLAFNDTQWTSGQGGVGYDTSPDYLPYIGINSGSSMRGISGTVLIRIPFHVSGDALDSMNNLVLKMRYDDGFVAYLNGREVVSSNAPNPVQWNSFAAGSHDDASAVQWIEFDISPHISQLRPGTNLLAIHGLNVSLSSSDFLIDGELEGGETRIVGGLPTTQAYQGPIAIDDLVTIRARALLGSEWSALTEAIFYTGTPSLVVTELNYHPGPPTASEWAMGFSNPDDFEFIELLNPGPGTLNLVGIRFVDGIEFDFSDSGITTLGAGQTLLLVKNKAAFEFRYGPGLPVAGEYRGNFSNGGETVEWVDADGLTLERFTYQDGPPWPEQADGDGPSLERIRLEISADLPENWKASRQANGHPGGWNREIHIESITQQNGRLIMMIQRQPGMDFIVQYKSDLAQEDWTMVDRIQSGSSRDPIEISIEIDDSKQSGFYRVMTE